MDTIFQSWKRAITPKTIGGFYPESYLTYILWLYTVYKILIQYTNLFKRYQTETIFQLFFNIDKGP